MRRLAILLAAFCTVLITGGCPYVNRDQASTPAYRPQSPHAARFVETIGSSRITVYPTIVRTPSETAYSTDSQRQIVTFLDRQVTTSVVSASRRLAPGTRNSPPQWDIFVADLARIGDQLKASPIATGYHLVLEIIFPPNSPSVWGIHCFILDHQGNNAFSFLLNSHHALFQAGGLATPDPSDAARDRLVANATVVALNALERQLEAPADDTAADDPGYSVTSQKISGPEHAISRLFIVSRVHERLREVVTHSFKHSLQSAFESNDIAAVVTVVPRDSPADGQFDRALEEHAADTLMLIDLDPLIRTRPDGYEAVVGTRFTATARQPPDWDPLWRATGKVDYITMFGPRYTAHAGIRKEFAWHTTAAIVRSFVRDMTGRPSAPVYTVTEDRQANGQRID